MSYSEIGRNTGKVARTTGYKMQQLKTRKRQTERATGDEKKDKELIKGGSKAMKEKTEGLSKRKIKQQ